MSSNIEIDITYTDGRTQTARVLPVTHVALERHFKVAFAEAFSGTPPFEYVYFMAWHAARTGLEFDDWMNTVAAIEQKASGESVDPTSPAVSAGE